MTKLHMFLLNPMQLHVSTTTALQSIRTWNSLTIFPTASKCAWLRSNIQR